MITGLGTTLEKAQARYESEARQDEEFREYMGELKCRNPRCRKFLSAEDISVDDCDNEFCAFCGEQL